MRPATTSLGSGTLTLTGAYTYTDGTNFNAGILSAGSAGRSAQRARSPLPAAHSSTAPPTRPTIPRFSAAANQAYNIDTDGQNVAYATGLTSPGGTLTKLGAGTLTLTGTNTYTGNTTVSADALAISAGSVGVNDSSANLTIDGPGNAAATVTLGGTATLDQSLLFVGYAQSGTFTQSGSTNNVDRGLFLGFDGNPSATGNGTYTLSGGTVSIAEVLVGYSATGSTQGPGIFNQENGLVTATDGVAIGQNNQAVGTYNLDGGLLQVTGNNADLFAGPGSQYDALVVGGTVTLVATCASRSRRASRRCSTRASSSLTTSACRRSVASLPTRRSGFTRTRQGTASWSTTWPTWAPAAACSTT